MDPLSTAASIAGLLSAAVSIGKVLTPYVSAARDTPQVAHHVNAETQSVSIILSALQSLAQNMASVPIQRAALVDVDQVIAVLTSGVFVFSDLEASIGTMTHPDSSSLGRLASLRSRFQWARKETELTALLSRLQSFKSSISLILGILQSDTSLLAEQRQAELAANVHQLLDNNRELSRRLMNLEDSFDARIVATKRHSIAGSIISKVGNERHLLPNDALSSSETSKSPASPQAPFVSGFEFEDEINESGPYRRVQRDTMDFSFRSSIARSHAWSIFSGLSLSNISVMAVIALPIYADEITNSRHYQFGGQRLSMLPFADTSTSPFDDNDSLLRRCLKVQRQLSDLPGFGSVFEHPAPSNHPFKAIQYLFNQGKPLVSLCRCFEQFSVSDRNEELHYYQEQNRAAKNAAYLALKAISESSVFRTQSSEIPTIAEILSSDVVSFLKVVSMIETILALENHVVLPQIDEIQYHSGLNGDSDDFLLLDDFTRRSWKALQHLIGLTSDELVGTFGLLTAVEWQAMFKPILRILGTELRFLLEVEANLLRPVAERQWATAFQIWETRLKDYGHVIGSQPRNSKLLRSRVAGADLPRIQAIGKALDQISFPSRSVEMKSEFFSTLRSHYSLLPSDDVRPQECLAEAEANLACCRHIISLLAREEEMFDVVTDLCARVEDWKGQEVKQFGKLLLYDTAVTITIPQTSNRAKPYIRTLRIYLFENVFICCKEIWPPKSSKAKTLRYRKLETPDHDRLLELKAWIYIHGITGILEHADHLTIAISWQPDRKSATEAFHILFSTEGQAESWSKRLRELKEPKVMLQIPRLDAMIEIQGDNWPYLTGDETTNPTDLSFKNSGLDVELVMQGPGNDAL